MPLPKLTHAAKACISALNAMSLSFACAAAFAALSAAPAHAEITEDVRIGVMTDNQGTFARIGGLKEVGIAVRMAYADYQAEGGKLHAQFYQVDEGLVGAQSTRNAEELIKRNHVSMITGLVSSATGVAVFKVGGERKVVTFQTSGSSTLLINSSCTPYSVQAMQNTYNLAKGTVADLVKQGKKKWFLVNANYAFGTTLRDDARTVIEANGGSVVGTISHEFPETDFSKVVAAAKAADADAIGVASAGSDMVGFLNAAADAKVASDKKIIAPLSLFLQDINDLGMEKAGGLVVYGSFFWNQSPQTLEFSKRFYKQALRMPDMAHAVAYSSVYQYLKAAEAVGEVDNDKIMAYLKAHKINDAIYQNATIRADGSMIHDGYVVRIKTEAEAANPWDYYEKVRAVKGEDIAFPIERSTCANVVAPKAVAAVQAATAPTVVPEKTAAPTVKK